MKLASFALLAFSGAILTCSGLPDVIDNAMVHLGAGDWALANLMFAMHRDPPDKMKLLAKYLAAVKKYRGKLEKDQNELLHLKTEGGSSLESLRNLITEQNYLLMNKMDGILRGDEVLHMTRDEEMDHFLEEV